MASDQHISQEHPDRKVTAEKAPPPNESSSEKPSAEKPTTEFSNDEEDARDTVEIAIDTPKSKIEESEKSKLPENEMEVDNSSTFDDLTNRLMVAEQKLKERQDDVLRVQAEMENLRKRSAREVEHAHKYGLDRFVSELLPVKDSLELGVTATNDTNVNVDTMREGMELTLKMFGTVMEKFGIEEVYPSQDERFDPERHQAMSVQEDKGKESGTILIVVQKGYSLNGRLVRPAMVIVAK
uniref:Protein GrpE n=1 Tax=Candidatus Kentrum sp. LFY TaxID=2126342 RepID=A0A450UKH2_9GAMM|nr:MAG: molecular chaperone GrpE [Candidatus Kentron sp. LFY]